MNIIIKIEEIYLIISILLLNNVSYKHSQHIRKTIIPSGLNKLTFQSHPHAARLK